MQLLEAGPRGECEPSLPPQSVPPPATGTVALNCGVARCTSASHGPRRAKMIDLRNAPRGDRRKKDDIRIPVFDERPARGADRDRALGGPQRCPECLSRDGAPGHAAIHQAQDDVRQAIAQREPHLGKACKRRMMKANVVGSRSQLAREPEPRLVVERRRKSERDARMRRRQTLDKRLTADGVRLVRGKMHLVTTRRHRHNHRLEIPEVPEMRRAEQHFHARVRPAAACTPGGHRTCPSTAQTVGAVLPVPHDG